MNKQAATLETVDLTRDNHRENAHMPTGNPMRFSYKTGAKPLSGFTIKRGVGVGGFGEVYFAISDAGKEVALKQIQRNLDVEVRGVTQCLNLKHPNLIALYDIKYDDEGQAWVVMEYVAGESLKDVIDRNPNGLPHDDVKRLFGEVAAGVIYLHDHGIVHRDLKPGNIFDDDGVVKIGDYGLSKFISCSRRSGQTESVGTFHYMAPEIGKGVYGKEIDVYAMGIILYEMLTGRVPFDGESTQEIIMKHLTDDPDVSGIPQPFADVIRRALRKDPSKRFPNVREMLAAFDDGRHADPPAPVAIADEYKLADEEPIFINDDGIQDDQEMVFGPVTHRTPVTTREIPPVRYAGQMSNRNQNQAGAANARCGVHGRSQVAAGMQPGRCRREGSRSLCSSTPAKLLLLIGLGLLLVFNPWLVPFGLIIAVPYLIYVSVRALSGGSQEYRSTAIRHADVNWRPLARDALRRKPAADRISELTGSMLSAAFICAAICLAMLMVLGQPFENGDVETWSRFAWLTVASTAGAWLLLALGKFWESSDGDRLRRRVVMLFAGAFIGAIAFGTGRLLMIEIPNFDEWTVTTIGSNQWSHNFYTADGVARLPAYMIYFAGLFVILRWWTQADPLRGSRLSLFATSACVFWAWIMYMFCQFPQPWGLIIAATVSIAVQLSSPWVTNKERHQVA